eukprot:351309-Chlamydomonas_euryale.AAC.8
MGVGMRFGAGAGVGWGCAIQRPTRAAASCTCTLLLQQVQSNDLVQADIDLWRWWSPFPSPLRPTYFLNPAQKQDPSPCMSWPGLCQHSALSLTCTHQHMRQCVRECMRQRTPPAV